MASPSYHCKGWTLLFLPISPHSYSHPTSQPINSFHQTLLHWVITASLGLGLDTHIPALILLLNTRHHAIPSYSTAPQPPPPSPGCRPSWSLAWQQPMLKLEVEYYLQLEDVKQYYFLHDVHGVLADLIFFHHVGFVLFPRNDILILYKTA